MAEQLTLFRERVALNFLNFQLIPVSKETGIFVTKIF